MKKYNFGFLTVEEDKVAHIIMGVSRQWYTRAKNAKITQSGKDLPFSRLARLAIWKGVEIDKFYTLEMKELLEKELEQITRTI